MFSFVKRISLFLMTNLAVLVLVGVVMYVIGLFFPGLLSQGGGFVNLLIYAAIFGFGGSFISLAISRWQAKKAYNIILIEKSNLHSLDRKLQSVYTTVERIAKENHINMPEVGYYESGEPNAFATGATKNSALVAVSTGLLENMKENEVIAVIGHEMAHILNGDMVTLTLITGVLNTFVIVISQIAARAVSSFLTRGEEENSLSQWTYMGIYMGLQLVFGLLASLVIMWFSRKREYRADIGGAQYTGKAGMIAALRKLQSLSTRETHHLDHGNLKAFMITEPDSFFSTHPSLDNRIKALEENYRLP